MPLLTGTWDQALLAATVKVAAEEGASGYLGRTALQKIIYFLQVAGVPMRYSFDLYHYGPYCERISRDVELLTADSVLADESTEPSKFSNYRPGGEADELLVAHPGVAGHIASIRKVVHALLPLRPERLELLATLDYLYRQVKAGGGSGPWKDRVVERFISVKKQKFSRADVETAYDVMAQVGLVDR